MRSRLTLSTLRRISHIEEQMIRASMPHTSAADAAPLLPQFARDAIAIASRKGSRLVRPLTATIAERACSR
jgi:hypothetical protein